MTRYILLMLLLATSVAVAAGKKEMQGEAGIASAQLTTKAAQGTNEHAKGEPLGERTTTAASDEKVSAGEDAKAQAGKNALANGNSDPKEKTDQGEQTAKDQGGKLVAVPGGTALGMSLLGNQEAPKSLVIVPWKSSELGRVPGITPMLDDSRQPVDKEVFMRALRYYEIRSGTKP
jgi:hypothetical protein